MGGRSRIHDIKCIHTISTGKRGVANEVIRFACRRSSNGSVHSSETEFCSQLAYVLNARAEVVTPIGRIDVLTDDRIIEVKRARLWKHALGQVSAYAHYYPDHRKTLFLLNPEREVLKLAKQVCLPLGVSVFTQISDFDRAFHGLDIGG